MIRGMNAALTGLRAQQAQIDIIGDNLANVQTPGFKSSGAVFEALFAQVAATASGPSGATAGQNPIQFGMGVRLAATRIDFRQGALMTTDVPTDLALEGDGFFLVSTPTGIRLTRVGQFRWAADGSLVLPAGERLLGWVAEGFSLPSDLPLNPSDLKPITLQGKETMPPQATSRIAALGNLDASLPAGSATVRPVTVYDPIGRPHVVLLRLEKTAPGAWNWSLSLPSGLQRLAGDTVGTVRFKPDGGVESVSGATGSSRASATTGPLTWTARAYGAAGNGLEVVIVDGTAEGVSVDGRRITVVVDTSGGTTWSRVRDLVAAHPEASAMVEVSLSGPDGPAAPSTVTLSGGLDGTPAALQLKGPEGGEFTVTIDLSRLTQYASEGSVRAEADGWAPGTLVRVDVGPDGVVTAVYSNGRSASLARLAVGLVSNPQGLQRLSSNLWAETPQSGGIRIALPGKGGAAVIRSGALEQSNVDLVGELARLVVAQRAFQAAARAVGATDTLLREATEMIRT